MTEPTVTNYRLLRLHGEIYFLVVHELATPAPITRLFVGPRSNLVEVQITEVEMVLDDEEIIFCPWGKLYLPSQQPSNPTSKTPSWNDMPVVELVFEEYTLLKVNNKCAVIPK